MVHQHIGNGGRIGDNINAFHKKARPNDPAVYSRRSKNSKAFRATALALPKSQDSCGYRANETGEVEG